MNHRRRARRDPVSNLVANRRLRKDMEQTLAGLLPRMQGLDLKGALIALREIFGEGRPVPVVAAELGVSPQRLAVFAKQCMERLEVAQYGDQLRLHVSADVTSDVEGKCAYCGRPLPRQEGPGRRRKYCPAPRSCRQRRYKDNVDRRYRA